MRPDLRQGDDVWGSARVLVSPQSQGWIVQDASKSRASSTHLTQEDAINAAAAEAASLKGGTVIVQDRQGRHSFEFVVSNGISGEGLVVS